MQFYDTATRSVRAFEPPGPVSLYVCGITPYDSSHLGHAFTYHVFDVLTRRLLAAGHPVRSVRNVTDVDDDIFRAARDRRVPVQQLVAAEVARFDRGMAALGILPVLEAPRAGDHVPDMVNWVVRLEAAGFAYAVDGWVYFDTGAYAAYGTFSGLPRERLIELSRERGANPDDPRKRDALDFVLWQPSAPDESVWPSPWGDGRPGWHIECTVLATKFLGLPIDIHGGGDDLVYPHHESEIAQSEAIDPTVFAGHWMHVAMVELDGVKMSKSLGNLVFVDDLLARVPAAVIRILLNSHHYRRAWSYHEDELTIADGRRRAYADAVRAAGVVDTDVAGEAEARFFAALDDDLDTPEALRILDVAAAAVTCAARGSRPAGGVDGGLLITRLADVLGVRLDS